MTLLWFVAGASLLVALAAWSRARRTAKRLAQLSEMLWELKYQHGELRARVQRIAGEPAAASARPPVPEPHGEAFVPLASVAARRTGSGGTAPER